MNIEVFSPCATEGAHRAPTNAARVNLTPVGRRGAPSNSRSSGTARVARLRPGDVVETLRVSPPSRGAAQLAPR